MAKFKIKWSTGKEEQVEQSDCETVEQYVNCRFGRGADLEAFGVEVTVVGEKEEPKAPATKAPATKAPATKAPATKK